MSYISKIIDLTFIENLCNGDSDRIKKYITIHLLSSSKQFNQLKVYLDEQNWENLATVAHSLKPQVEYLGISGMKENLMEIIDIARYSNDKLKLSELVERSVALNEKAIAELETIFQNL